MNRRRILTKYQLGNLIFLGAAFFFGIIFSTYISQLFKIYYVWYSGVESWPFLICGLLVLALGLSVITSVYVARRLIFDTVFIYTTAIVLFMSYWTLFFINICPQYGMFLFPIVPIIIGLLLSLMAFIWKRNGGAIVWIFFVCGIVFTGVLRIVFPVTLSSTFYIVRFSFLIIALIVMAYLLGFIGMFKGRKTYVFPVVVFMFLSILYPFNIDSVMNSKCGENCVNRYETGKRQVDVLFGRYSDNNESYMFVENRKTNNFTYPMENSGKLFLYMMLLQHPNPKSLLLCGDVPLGAIEIYKSIYSLQDITLLPFDINDALSKARLANPSVYSQVKIYDSKDEVNNKFDETIIFLPAFNTVNIASLLNDSFARASNDGSLIYIGNVSNAEMLFGPIQAWLKERFKKIETMQSGSLIAIAGSNNETYLTISADALKLRYLEQKISYDYTKMRVFIEGIKPFAAPTSDKPVPSFGNVSFINDYVFAGTYKGARAFAYIALFFVLIYFSKYLFFVRNNRISTFYYSDLLFSSMLSASMFVLALFYYQYNWGELYSKLPVGIGLFVVGIIFATMLYYYLGVEKYYAYYLIIAAALVVQVNLLWMVLMRKIDFSPYVWLFMLLFGLSTVFSFSNVIVKPKDAMNVNKVLYISGLMSAGFGLGVIICTEIFIPLLGMDYSAYLLFLCSLITIVFHAFIFGRAKYEYTNKGGID